MIISVHPQLILKTTAETKWSNE